MLLAAVVLAAAVNANASVRIGGWAFSANGQLARDFQYSGPCPVNLKFDWGVISTEAASAAYTITRNDGGHSSNVRYVDLPPNRSVPIVEEWRLGANNPTFADYHGWMELHLESPNPVTHRISFMLHCGGMGGEMGGGEPVVRVGGWAFSANGQLARDFQYTGYCPVDLTFDWGVIGAINTPATYWFSRSDGGRSGNPSTANLQAGRSVPILDHWRLGANTPQFADFHGSVELNIESPTHLAHRIAFTLHCR